VLHHGRRPGPKAHGPQDWGESARPTGLHVPRFVPGGVSAGSGPRWRRREDRPEGTFVPGRACRRSSRRLCDGIGDVLAEGEGARRGHVHHPARQLAEAGPSLPRGTRDTTADARRRVLMEKPSPPPRPGPRSPAGRGFTRLSPRPYGLRDARSAAAASGSAAHPYIGAHREGSLPARALQPEPGSRRARLPCPAGPETAPPAPSKGSQEGTATRSAANLIHHQTAC